MPSLWLTRPSAMVMTAMLRAEEPFPLSLPEAQQSAYFSTWYRDISRHYRGDVEKRYNSAMSATQAAQQIISAVEANRSGKIWVGSMAWIFKWVWPLLSTWRQDKINNDLLHVELLRSEVKG
jgi:hypothetical protein